MRKITYLPMGGLLILTIELKTIDYIEMYFKNKQTSLAIVLLEITRMDGITLLGLVAGVMTTAAFFPQLIKVIKTRSTKDISLIMYLVFCTGVLLWLIYGVYIDSLPIIAANIVTLLITIAILIYKIKYH